MHVTARPFATASLALVASSLIAVTPVAPPPDLHRVTGAAVRLADASSDLLGDLGNLGGLANDLGGVNLGGLANIPYNVFADIVNIPYNEIQAIGTYAAALGPAGQSVVPDVPGLLTTVELPVGLNGALEPVIEGPVGPGGAFEPLGIAGTGSWWWESLGNTWGWDNGNFAQVDAIANMLVPFPQFETPFAEELQVLAEAEIVAGAKANCEFECASVLGDFANWFKVPLSQLLSGYTFGTVVANTVGANSATGVINFPQDTVWSNTPVVLNPLLPFESLAANLTGSPANNPIMLPDPGTAITNIISLSNELNYLDFNPFATGSFLYWGAPTLYSVPAFFGGLLQDLTGIPNQFPLTNYGAEPITGYTASLPQLVQGLPEGFAYLLSGLLGYVNPTLAADLSGPLDALGNLGTLPADLLESTGIADLWAFLTTALPQGIADLNTQVAAVLSSLLGTDLASNLTTNLSTLLPTLGTDLASMLGPDLASNLTTNLSTLLPTLGTDLASMLGPDLASNLTANLSTLLPTLGTDLASMLGTQLAVNLGSLIPQLALSLIP